MKKKNENGHFNHDHHLTDEQVALCVEVMLKRIQESELSDQVKLHLQECDACNERVSGLYMDVKDEKEISDLIPAAGISSRKFLSIPVKFYRYGIAAVFLLFIVTGSYFIFRSPSPEKIFNQYFEPYPNIITVKSEGSNDLSQAMLYYETHDWDSAIVLLLKNFTVPKENPDICFYLGNAFLAKGETEQAVYWFNSALEAGTKYRNQVSWYLSLAYLRNNEMNSAKLYLEELRNENNFYRERADQLLKKIK